MIEKKVNEILIDGSVPPKSCNMHGVDSIEINSFNNHLFKNEVIENYIEQMKCKENIKVLTISFGVTLSNLEILKHFQNLEKFFIHSETVLSFQGLSHLKSLKRLDVDTEKNKKRSLEELACTSTLESMGVEFGNLGDYEAIRKCTSLTGVCIGRGPAPDFNLWHKVPLDGGLKFWNYCSFSELKDMAYLPSLSEVMIGACQKFRCFKGDNSNIKTLRIDGSKYFDISSLETCPSIEKLWIGGSIPILPLDDFPEMENVKIIEMPDIKIDFGRNELEQKMPNLKTFYFSRGGTKDELINLSKNNKNVLICKTGKGYMDGVQVYNKYEWLQEHGWYSFTDST